MNVLLSINPHLGIHATQTLYEPGFLHIVFCFLGSYQKYKISIPNSQIPHTS